MSTLPHVLPIVAASPTQPYVPDQQDIGWLSVYNCAQASPTHSTSRCPDYFSSASEFAVAQRTCAPFSGHAAHPSRTSESHLSKQQFADVMTQLDCMVTCLPDGASLTETQVQARLAGQPAMPPPVTRAIFHYWQQKRAARLITGGDVSPAMSGRQGMGSGAPSSSTMIDNAWLQQPNINVGRIATGSVHGGSSPSRALAMAHGGRSPMHRPPTADLPFSAKGAHCLTFDMRSCALCAFEWLVVV